MKLRKMILCAFFAALTAALSQIAVPIGAVPVNLATFSVLCAGALLGSRAGAVSQLVYVLLGAAGAPVFSMLRGGAAVLVGPTGGYIAGYVLAAFAVGFVCERGGGARAVRIAAVLCGFAVYMTAGTLWYMYVTGSPLSAALAVCVIPFLPGDAVKMAAAVVLTERLAPALGAMPERA